MEDDLLKVFVQESKEHLETLEPTLLALEDRHEKSSIEAAFRACIA
jgi:chemotaxis protein histidine kinase CheA